MMTKTLRVLATAILIGLPLAAHAGQAFDNKTFSDAQAAGKSILVDVSAPWCPTCAQQKPIIQEVEKTHPNLTVFDVDFDSAKEVLRKFRVQYQSTLIVFEGATEVGRSTGETDPAAIGTLIAKGL
jgi:thiol-disulfide isomerase/thioredoxin